MKLIEFGETTKIKLPLPWAISIIGCLVTAGSWLTILSVEQATAKVNQAELKAEVNDIQIDRIHQREKLYDLMYKMDQRLSRIEGKLDRIDK